MTGERVRPSCVGGFAMTVCGYLLKKKVCTDHSVRCFMASLQHARRVRESPTQNRAERSNLLRVRECA